MTNWSKKFLLALCLVLTFAVTAVAEEVTLPAVTVTVSGAAVEVTGDVLQPALNAEVELTDSVTTTLVKSAEGVWTVAGVAVSGTPAEATAEETVPAAELVTAAGVCEGVETVVALENAGLTVAAYTAEDGLTYADVTVNATAVAAAMGEEYTVGDLKATTLTFTTVDGVTSVKVAFDIVKPAAETEGEVVAEAETVYVYYVDGVDDEVVFPAYKMSAKVGDKTPAFPGETPVREGYEFNGWGPVNPIVKGETIYEAQWLEYFDVTYVNGIDGTVLAEFVVLEGQPTPAYPYENPTWDDHEFNGWAPAVAETVTGDATYEAQWLEYFDIVYFDWYDQKVLEQFEVLEGQPTPTIDPDRYTKASYVNMGFTTAIAPIVTGDATYTMMQMVPPRENNVSGLKFICNCPNNDDHDKNFTYFSTVADYLRLDGISEDVYFDGTNYKCVVYLGSDYTDFTTYYCNKVSSRVKNNHTFVSSDTTSFTVTLDMSTKRWVADISEINVQFVCPTAPVVTDKTYSSTKIRVKGPVAGVTKTLAGMYLDAGNVSVGAVTGNATDGWFVNVTVTNYEPYIVKFEEKYGVDCVADTATTGTLVYTFTYTMPSNGLIATDGSGWTFAAPSNDVKWNGYTIWVTEAE